MAKRGVPRSVYMCKCGCGQQLEPIAHGHTIRYNLYIRGHHHDKNKPFGSRRRVKIGGSTKKGGTYWRIKVNVDGIPMWPFEHRYLMEQLHGRKLLTSEHVHHINGDKLDNRIENLMVLTDAEHAKLTNMSRRDKWKIKDPHMCPLCKLLHSSTDKPKHSREPTKK